MMEIAGVADFANMEGMLCTCMLSHRSDNRHIYRLLFLKEVALQLKELAQQATYYGDIRDKFE